MTTTRLTVAVLLIVVVAGCAASNAPADEAVPAPPEQQQPANGWVAYTVEPGGDRGDIWIVREGAAPRRIIGSNEGEVTQVCPSFSPDGTLLAYSEIEGRFPPPTDADGEPYRGSSVVVVDFAGGALNEPVVRIPARVEEAGKNDGRVCPKWSPDGRFLAYQALTMDDWLMVVGLDGSETVLSGPWSSLTPPPADPKTGRVFGSSLLSSMGGNRDFEWSPDSTQIAVATDTGLWLVPISGEEPVLVSDTHPFTKLSWSPTGDELAVTFQDDVQYIGRIPIQENSFVANRWPGRDPIWSPDGSWIAYHSAPQNSEEVQQGQSPQLRIVDPDRRASQPITSPPTADDIYGVTWSPDSTKLVFVVSFGTGKYGLTVVSIEEGTDRDPIALVQPTQDLEETSSSAPGDDDISWQAIYP